MKKVKYIIKAFGKDAGGFQGKATKPVGGGKQGLQLLPSKTNPNVRRWEQTQQGQLQQQQQGQTQRKPYWGKHSGAEIGHKINYHGNHINITGVGEHGVTARDEHGRKYEIFHHELKSANATLGKNGKKGI